MVGRSLSNDLRAKTEQKVLLSSIFGSVWGFLFVGAFCLPFQLLSHSTHWALTLQQIWNRKTGGACGSPKTLCITQCSELSTFLCSQCTTPNWAWGWLYFIPSPPQTIHFISFLHIPMSPWITGKFLQPKSPSAPFWTSSTRFPASVSPTGTKEQQQRGCCSLTWLSWETPAQTGIDWGFPVSRAHRNLFFMLSLLPPQPTPLPEAPGKHDQNKNCDFPVWKRKCFLPTHILLLQPELPAAGLLTSPALQETTCALLQALCTLGLVARETLRCPHCCPRATRAGLCLEQLGCQETLEQRVHTSGASSFANQSIF